MRLFSPKEVQQKKTEGEQVKKSRYLAGLLKDQGKNLDTLQRQAVIERQRIEDDFEKFNLSIQVRRSNLSKEVTILEDRKAKALEPLDAKEYELTVKEQELTDLGKTLNGRDAILESEKAKLVDQLMFVEDKKDELASREQEIKNKERSIELQRELLISSTNELNQRWQNFNHELAGKETKIEAENKDIANRTKHLDIIKDNLDKREQDLIKYKVQLDDRAATLERSWAELRSKYGNT